MATKQSQAKNEAASKAKQEQAADLKALSMGARAYAIDAAGESLTTQRTAFVIALAATLGAIKTGEEWEQYGNAFATQYAEAGSCSNDSGKRAFNRYAQAVKQHNGVAKPQSDEAIKKQAQRFTKEVQDITNALLTGNGAIEAEETLLRWEKSSDEQRANAAKTIKANTQAAKIAREKQEDHRNTLRRQVAAFELVAAFDGCALTKAQKARLDALKAELAESA